jgi:hypothetical protein
MHCRAARPPHNLLFTHSTTTLTTLRFLLLATCAIAEGPQMQAICAFPRQTPLGSTPIRVGMMMVRK